MKSKPTEVSTVIIVNKNRQRTLQVKTKHLNNLKHYALSIFGLIVILSASIIYLRSQNKQQELEKNQLLSQLVKLKNEAPVPIPIPQVNKTSNAQAYIQNIQGRLQKINEYLRKRGLKGFSTATVGGSGNDEGSKLTDDQTYSLYEEYLNRLERTVAFTPMGYPRVSPLTSFFGYRGDPFNSDHAEFHPGIDFKGHRGDEARCTANGKVVSAGWNGGYGKCVRIAHANSFETLYGHLSRITVKVGQEVIAGQKIGEVGSTGRSTGTHLHYEVRKNGKAINPVKFLSLNN